MPPWSVSPTRSEVFGSDFVSLADFTEDRPIEVVPSDAESIRFGYEFGRCNVPVTSSASGADVAQAIRNHNADITVLRFPAHHLSWFEILTRSLGDWRLIYADTLVYWELTVGAGNPPDAIDGVVVAIAGDAAIISDLTNRVFSEYASHYSANPLLSGEAATAGYQEWASMTPLHNALILFSEGSPAGIATLETSADQIEILLAGTVPAVRGRGLYPHLLNAVESRALAESSARVVISTQSHNTVVQRAWARYGFLPLTSLITVHAVKKALFDETQT